MLRSVVPFGCPKTNGLKLLSVGVREPPPSLLYRLLCIMKSLNRLRTLGFAELSWRVEEVWVADRD